MVKVEIYREQDRAYPKNLLGLDGSPQKLFVKGKLLKRDALAVAIVGTRVPSQEGLIKARHFATILAKVGLTIVSGLARGIDTVAHKSALEAGGRTIAVLASGIDIIYPPENGALAKKIANQGALLTEFAEGVSPSKQNFLVRNRIISGLSLATLVIEGARQSGTISTAAHAARQGREVFAIPGSGAADYLLENGATKVENPYELLAFLRTALDTIW